MSDLLSSARVERDLAINHLRKQMIQSWNIGNTREARWLEKCLTELEEMSVEEFADQFKDVDE